MREKNRLGVYISCVRICSGNGSSASGRLIQLDYDAPVIRISLAISLLLLHISFPRKYNYTECQESFNFNSNRTLIRVKDVKWLLKWRMKHYRRVQYYDALAQCVSTGRTWQAIKFSHKPISQDAKKATP
ncbi:hypothetical protein XELAEV_18011003mg [Xenopus laevis]|uniref:Uncharacterized protein n=1 Tax=Xenopus laevis TaxID=8355 RepID=A0A974DVA2_XENLA|nr:hypothetical protein XELAEV_18011003mg [Xenopus laevis]